MSLNTGMKMIKTETVTVENAAKTLGSGSLLVYGTPAMLLLVEKTAVALLDGKKLVFAVEVKDPAGVIGKGTHERFIVDAEKFQNKANGKFDK